MSRRRRRTALVMGHDSFLDIVANLVGILIILVVVLGSRTRQVAEAVQSQAATAEVSEEELIAELRQSISTEEDVHRLERALAVYAGEIDHRRQERAVLMDLLSAARQAWEEARSGLDEASQRAAELEAQRQLALAEMEELEMEKGRLEGAEAPVAIVEHLPTPMAKTVFGTEIHFRLKAGRLSVVPLDPLVGEIRREFERSLMSGREGTAESTVGPVRGYVAQYRMERSRTTINRGGSTGTGVRLELVEMTLQPVEEPFGDPVDEVVRPGSSPLDIELAGRDPQTTTITVWVYPDSFGQFRRLKEYLYGRGFATAARPLPDNRPISGGPQGSRSNAQ
jgi:hypothetical protein